MGRSKYVLAGIGIFLAGIVASQFILTIVFLFLNKDEIVMSEMSEEHDDYVTTSVLIGELERGVVFRIKNLINIVNRRGSEIEVLHILNDVWLEKTDKYPNFAWDKLKLPIVKVEISNLLLQSHINKKIEIDYEKVHSYVFDMVDNDDPIIVSKAIRSLTIPDHLEDVEKIFSIAQKENARTFKSAIHTLNYMCNESASEALVKLKDSISDKNREYVEEITLEAAEYKPRSGWCNRTPL